MKIAKFDIQVENHEDNEETEDATNQVLDILEEWGLNQNSSGLGNAQNYRY